MRLRIETALVLLALLIVAVESIIVSAETRNSQRFVPEEATISSIHAALSARAVTCVQVIQSYLNRVNPYDHKGPALNSIITVPATHTFRLSKCMKNSNGQTSMSGRVALSTAKLEEQRQQRENARMGVPRTVERDLRWRQIPRPGCTKHSIGDYVKNCQSAIDDCWNKNQTQATYQACIR